ncbi:MAG: single-stranded DNA-binding protein [Deltaproteobacteria bacterium]|nr:MAG: single-stranded DNA-binding protein [Deltaproteobacteria bacterium]
MSINSVTLVGRLGAHPERRVTSSGKNLCKMSVATDFWDKQQQAKVAEWHNVVAWDQQAENCLKYLDKGSQVAVEGSIRTRRFDGQDGKPRYWTEIIARRITFLSKNERSSAGALDVAMAPVNDEDIPF